MLVAIILRLDRATVGRIEAMRDGLPDPAEQRQHRPCIVLASYGGTVDVADLDACLATATNRWKKLPITMSGIFICPGNPATFGLLVAPTIGLFQHHETIHRTLTDLPTHPSYETGMWTPNVMLGKTNLLADTVEVLASRWTGAIVGSVVSLDLVQLDPLETLSSRPLRD